MIFYYPALLGLLAVHAAAQDLVGVLSFMTGFTNFTSYVSQFPDLLAQMNSGNYTVLAPTDTAITAFLNTGVNPTSENIKAVIQYHCLQGIHPIVTFDSKPQFVPTLLTNPVYSNVTGGQVVEVVADNGTVSIYTAIKAQSNITSSDIIYSGGLIQIIDKVLSIPITLPATISAAGLNDLIALVNSGGLLADPEIGTLVLESMDLTVLGPNNPNYSTTWGGLTGLDMASIVDIFEYNVIRGTVVYSSELENGTEYKTVEGRNLTVTIFGNDTYFNAANVTMKDFITSNGVLQVLDRPNNPNDTSARPTWTPQSTTSSSTTSSSGLSTGAKAGIGVGVGLGVPLVLALLFFLYRHRRRGETRKSTVTDPETTERPFSPSTQSQPQDREPTIGELKAGGFGAVISEPHPSERRPQTHESDATNLKELEGARAAAELHGMSASPPPHYQHEIDGLERPTLAGHKRDTSELDGIETPRRQHTRETSELDGKETPRPRSPAAEAEGGLVSPELDRRFTGGSGTVSPGFDGMVSPELDRTFASRVDGTTSPGLDGMPSSGLEHEAGKKG